MKELNLENVRILIHSAIRIEGSKVLYFDPFHLAEEPHDADFIFITHDHFDHFSAEDVKKVASEKTILCAPLSCKESIEKSEVLPKENLVWLKPGDSAVFGGIKVLSVAAYNIGKKFHPKENGWLGYVVTMDGVSYYVAGDTDVTPELLSVKADVALLPVGGTYTMTAEEAAEAALHMDIQTAVPTHFADIVGTPLDGPRFTKLYEEGRRK
ncbi:MAG: MBL fold metallo-hydrolase [Lachnospiraceae bacterium]|nr:MBL fold metallo-hydrolase [Lachnospiraceae bacterium]